MDKTWLSKDFYKILEIAENSDIDTIKKSYRNLAKKFHPDSNSGDTGGSEKFKEIAAAYSVLSDSSMRSEYDTLRKTLNNKSYTGERAQEAYTESSNFSGFSDFNIQDLYERSQDSPFLRNFFSNTEPQQGSDIETEIEVTLDDIISGATKIINIQATIPCSSCYGKAIMCLKCKNTRQEIFKQKIKVRIPTDTRSGTTIKITGKGYENPLTKTKGDTYLKIHVKPHPYYYFNSQNQLSIKVPILFAEAALGGDIEIPLLKSLRKDNEESIRIKVPAGTQDGTVFRVGDKTLFRKNDKIFYVTLQIVVPSKLSRSAKKTLERYTEQEGLENPRAKMLNTIVSY